MRRPERAGKRRTGLPTVAEPPARVGEDDRVRAEPPEQLPEQRRLRGAEHASESRMGDDGKSAGLGRHLVQERQPCEHRRDHHGARAGLPRERELAPHPLRRPDQVGDVEREASGVAGGILHRAKACLDPRLERAERMVGEPVVVLDHVDPRQGEGAAQRRELRRAEPHRLERRGQERTAGYAGQRPQPRDPRPRPRQPVERGLGDVHVVERDVGLERRIAEQDIEELRRIAGRGGERLRDRHPEQILARGDDLLHAAQDVRGHPGIPRRGGSGQLDRLLEQQRLRPPGHVRRGGVDEVGDAQRRVAPLGH